MMNGFRRLGNLWLGNVRPGSHLLQNYIIPECICMGWRGDLITSLALFKRFQIPGSSHIEPVCTNFIRFPFYRRPYGILPEELAEVFYNRGKIAIDPISSYYVKLLYVHHVMAQFSHKYLAMPLSDKRQQYSGGDYVALSDIPTWKNHYVENRPRLQSLLEQLKEKKAGWNINYTANNDLADKVSLLKGDITKLEIGAIVNAANNSLLGGGGVDGAIHRAAGPDLLEECRLLNGCKTGEAKMTGGYKLPAKYVIHTVGPRGEKPDLLQSCYQNSLEIALKENIRSIAFPCISTGIYGYPQEAAALVALKTVRTILEKSASNIDRVIFCTFLPEDVSIYESYLQLFFPIE